MRILGIIPARGGSKGIPRKNIFPVNGKPLIAYTIENGLELQSKGIISELIVSTDDEEIAEISKTLGANVPFLRPESISGDSEKSITFILHAIDFFEKNKVNFDAVLLLQPTSPLRRLEDMQQAIQLFEEADNDSLISVCEEAHINDLNMYKMGENNIAKPLNALHNEGIRRQDYEPVFVRNGSIYITNVSYLKESNKIISNFPILYRMEQRYSVNIDSMEDIDRMQKFLSE